MSGFDLHPLPPGLDDDTPEFVPPSFERWLGRLTMTRTIAAMSGFLFTWLVAYESGMGWEASTIRAMIAAIVFHFIAWAMALFVFGELYDIEVRKARAEMQERERERNRRIEEYYRERLIAKGLIDTDGNVAKEGAAHGVPNVTPLNATAASVPTSGMEAQQAAA